MTSVPVLLTSYKTLMVPPVGLGKEALGAEGGEVRQEGGRGWEEGEEDEEDDKVMAEVFRRRSQSLTAGTASKSVGEWERGDWGAEREGDGGAEGEGEADASDDDMPLGSLFEAARLAAAVAAREKDEVSRQTRQFTTQTPAVRPRAPLRASASLPGTGSSAPSGGARARQAPGPVNQSAAKVRYELVADDSALDNALDEAFKQGPGRGPPLARQPMGAQQLRRSVICLSMPGEQAGGMKTARQRQQQQRALIPRLDDWYKSILALDYDVVVASGGGSPSREGGGRHGKGGLGNKAEEEEEEQGEDGEGKLVRVPLAFASPEDYARVFRPLVLEEFKAQVARAHEERAGGGGGGDGGGGEEGLTGVLRVMSFEKVDEFLVVQFTAEAGADGVARGCAESDLLLLSLARPPPGQPGPVSMLAKVERKDKAVYGSVNARGTMLQLRVYLPPGVPRLARARQHVKEHAKWQAVRILSLVPQLREFSALSSVSQFPLLPLLLNPRAPNSSNVSNPSNFSRGGPSGSAAGPGPGGTLARKNLVVLPESLREALQEAYNESQVAAIGAALGAPHSHPRGHHLALIQGPPGTGKTRTIVAIISALLAASRGVGSQGPGTSAATARDPPSLPAVRKPAPGQKLSANQEAARMQSLARMAIARSWQDAARAVELDSQKLTSDSANNAFGGSGGGGGSNGFGGGGGGLGGGRKWVRVLVCAQSNAAVDEIVARICGAGDLYGHDGLAFQPQVVRVGSVRTVHPNSLPVHIDTLVDGRVAQHKRATVGGGGAVDGRQGGGEQQQQQQQDSGELRRQLDEIYELITAVGELRSQQEGGGEKGEEEGGTLGPQEEGQGGQRGSEKGDKGGGAGEGAQGKEEEKGGATVAESDSVAKRAARIVAQGSAVTAAKLNVLHNRKREIQGQLARAKDASKRAFEEDRALRAALKRQLIREAQVVVTTLSGCGGDVFSACVDAAPGAAGGLGGRAAGGAFRNGKTAGEGLFDAVIIDEAAQALEPATLIPLQLLAAGFARCIMVSGGATSSLLPTKNSRHLQAFSCDLISVGDPKQLPATVLSRAASQLCYERSLFERLQTAGFPVTMLSHQYRMHPEIRRFPSAYFYERQLVDGEGISEASRGAPFHQEPPLLPYAFFDCVDGVERKGRPSLSNEAEVDVVLALYDALAKRYPEELRPGRVGIITPYKQQLALLRSRFARSYGAQVAESVEFNTVDGFQGREVDILIFSTVRSAENPTPASLASRPGGAGGGGSIGFVADKRRMNVALTRARVSLWIVGNSQTLRSSPPWAALLGDARSRGAVVPARRPYSSVFPGIRRAPRVAAPDAHPVPGHQQAQKQQAGPPARDGDPREAPASNHATCHTPRRDETVGRLPRGMLEGAESPVDGLLSLPGTSPVTHGKPGVSPRTARRRSDNERKRNERWGQRSDAVEGGEDLTSIAARGAPGGELLAGANGGSLREERHRVPLARKRSAEVAFAGSNISIKGKTERSSALPVTADYVGFEGENETTEDRAGRSRDSPAGAAASALGGECGAATCPTARAVELEHSYASRQAPGGGDRSSCRSQERGRERSKDKRDCERESRKCQVAPPQARRVQDHDEEERGLQRRRESSAMAEGQLREGLLRRRLSPRSEKEEEQRQAHACRERARQSGESRGDREHGGVRGGEGGSNRMGRSDGEREVERHGSKEREGERERGREQRGEESKLRREMRDEGECRSADRSRSRSATEGARAPLSVPPVGSNRWVGDGWRGEREEGGERRDGQHLRSKRSHEDQLRHLRGKGWELDKHSDGEMDRDMVRERERGSPRGRDKNRDRKGGSSRNGSRREDGSLRATEGQPRETPRSPSAARAGEDAQKSKGAPAGEAVKASAPREHLAPAIGSGRGPSIARMKFSSSAAGSAAEVPARLQAAGRQEDPPAARRQVAAEQADSEAAKRLVLLQREDPAAARKRQREEAAAVLPSAFLSAPKRARVQVATDEGSRAPQQSAQPRLWERAPPPPPPPASWQRPQQAGDAPREVIRTVRYDEPRQSQGGSLNTRDREGGYVVNRVSVGNGVKGANALDSFAYKGTRSPRAGRTGDARLPGGVPSGTDRSQLPARHYSSLSQGSARSSQQTRAPAESQAKGGGSGSLLDNIMSGLSNVSKAQVRGGGRDATSPPRGFIVPLDKKSR
eukprot:jgi/Mesen1/3805/ME000206S02990